MALVRKIKDVAGLRFSMIPNRIRFGSKIYKQYRFLQKSQWWDEERLRDYQLTHLRQVVRHAYYNTKFYRDHYDKAKIKPEDIRSFQDFKELPYITKDNIRDDLESMKAVDFENYSPVLTHTGGSTGRPVVLYRSKFSDIVRAAVEWRGFGLGGVNYYDRKLHTSASLTKDHSVEPWYYDYRFRKIVIQIVSIDDDQLKLFVGLCRRFKPPAIESYIEYLRLASKYLIAKNIRDIRPEGLFQRGAKVTEYDRKIIKEAFDCNLYDYYGMRENAVSASECDHGSLHINSEFTLIEFENNRVSASVGEEAEIIGTNLHNYALPLIRYRTGDRGLYLDKKCACGRGLPLMEITGGRDRDFIIIKGKYIFITHHITHVLGQLVQVEKLQLYQPDEKNIVIRIVPGKNYDKSCEMPIVEKLREIAGHEIEIRIEYHDDIPYTRLGKYRFVVSDISRNP
jgi:phenylacetate-CoA ligase